MNNSVPLESVPDLSRFTRTEGDEPLNGYRLLTPLGIGGFGEVWKCQAPGGELKAMKIVTTASHRDETQTVFAKCAINRVKEIRHPFLVSVDRVEDVSGELIIVMELADSSLLHEFENYRGAGLSGIPEDHLLNYVLQAAQVLDVMNFQHGFQHLDVKPANLLLCNGRVRLTDFGLVSSLVDPTGKGNRPVCGCCTPRYAPPELLQGVVSRFCDQYSLAFVYQELLTGSPPFEGAGLLKRLLTAPRLDTLPESDRAVVARALAPDPDDRFASCLEFAQALQNSRLHSRTTLNLPARRIISTEPRGPFPNDARNRFEQSRQNNDEGNSVDQQPPGNRPRDPQILHSVESSALRSPRDTVRAFEARAREPRPGERRERVDCIAESSELIYPPAIHMNDLRWKPDPMGDKAPLPGDLIAQLVAFETEHGWHPHSCQKSPDREQSDIIASTFIIPMISKEALGNRFATILQECRATELSRSDDSIVLAVEGSVPFWETFSSKQRVLKIVVNVEAPSPHCPEFLRATVRIVPLNPDGPSLHPTILNTRSLLFRKIREVLRAAPDRRRSKRWPCNFGVKLYPILHDWRLGPEIEAQARDLAGHGIGLISPIAPSTKQFYLRPAAPHRLSDYAILAEVVRHTMLADGSFAWGAAFGRI